MFYILTSITDKNILQLTLFNDWGLISKNTLCENCMRFL